MVGSHEMDNKEMLVGVFDKVMKYPLFLGWGSSMFDKSYFC